MRERTRDCNQKTGGGQIQQVFREERGAGLGPGSVPWGGAYVSRNPHIFMGKEVPGRSNPPVTQMSQHDCRERIIVGACWPIFSRRAQDKEAEENR